MSLIYLFQCETCAKKQSVRSEILDFRNRFNNYRCCQRKFAINEKVKQESFKAHFHQNNYCGEENWVITLTYKGKTNIELYRKKSFWQHEVNTFIPY